MTYPDSDTARQMRAHSPKPSRKIMWLIVLCGAGSTLLLLSVLLNK